MRTPRAFLALAVLLAAGTFAPAAQAVPRDPTRPCPEDPTGTSCGDHYLDSVPINRAGTKLTSAGDTVDTSRATTQGDLFVPGGRPGGPSEPTLCRGAGYGNTVWYDFYPHTAGDVLLQASALGFNPVLAIMPFDARTGRPDLSRFTCANDLATGVEQLGVEGLRRGQAYTVQVGGVGNTGGPLDFDLVFLADTDGDGVRDDQDVCDLREGKTKVGCVRALPRLAFNPTGGGVRLRFLSVRAPRGFKVSVRCRGCPPQARRARTVRFNRLRGRTLRAGTSLVIRVTKKDNIGAYFPYRVRRGGLTSSVERCLNPASRKPRRRCSY